MADYSSREKRYVTVMRERRSPGDNGVALRKPAQPAPLAEEKMSLHSSSAAVTMRHPVRNVVQHSSNDRKLLTAAALLVAVLIADVLLIWAVAPNLADLATFYVTTT